MNVRQLRYIYYSLLQPTVVRVVAPSSAPRLPKLAYERGTTVAGTHSQIHLISIAYPQRSCANIPWAPLSYSTTIFMMMRLDYHLEDINSQSFSGGCHVTSRRKKSQASTSVRRREYSNSPLRRRERVQASLTWYHQR